MITTGIIIYVIATTIATDCLYRPAWWKIKTSAPLALAGFALIAAGILLTTK